VRPEYTFSMQACLQRFAAEGVPSSGAGASGRPEEPASTWEAKVAGGLLGAEGYAFKLISGCPPKARPALQPRCTCGRSTSTPPCQHKLLPRVPHPESLFLSDSLLRTLHSSPACTLA